MIDLEWCDAVDSILVVGEQVKGHPIVVCLATVSVETFCRQ